MTIKNKVSHKEQNAMYHFYMKWRQQTQNAIHKGYPTLSFKDWFIHKVSRRFTHYAEQWVWKKRRQQMELFDQQWVFTYCKPSVFIDIGAAVGAYPIKLRKNGFKGKIIAIEPNKDFFYQLEKHRGDDKNWVNINCAVSDNSNSADIYMCTNGGTSSLLKPTDYLTYNSGSKCKQVESIACMTLDQIIDMHAPDTDDIYIKIDVQGLEKKVICGGGGYMHKVLGLKMEMAVNNSDYENQPHMWDIIQYMRDLGFVLVHLEHTWRDVVGGSHELIYVDGVFLNKSKMEHRKDTVL